MGEIAKLLLSAPDRLRARLAAGTVEAARVLDAELQKQLDRSGTRRTPSQPGEPPRRQTGQLQRETKAVADPRDLSISVQTSAVGRILNLGNRSGTLAPRPWLKPAVEASAAARRAALFGKP